MTHSATNLWHLAPSFVKVIDQGIHALNFQSVPESRSHEIDNHLVFSSHTGPQKTASNYMHSFSCKDKVPVEMLYFFFFFFFFFFSIKGY
jgi:hypothetical protein